MRRGAALAFWFWLGSVAGAELSAQAPGKVSSQPKPRPQVHGRVPPEALRRLEKESQVRLGMHVETDRAGEATIEIGTEEKQGFVSLGPATKVVFTDFVFGRAQGLRPQLGILMSLGMLRIALRPRLNRPQEGEYFIVSPRGEQIRLLGTDAYVKVAQDGSLVVAVIEGRVQIVSKAGVVELGAGEVYLGPDQPRGQIPPGGGNGPPPGFPGEFLPVDPPQFDDLRFDLPK